MHARVLGIAALLALLATTTYAEPDDGAAADAGTALRVPGLKLKTPQRRIQRYGYGLGLASLHLNAEWLTDPRLKPAESASAEPPPTGFVNLTIPDQLTPATVAAAAGVFAGKMLLLRELCSFGTCRVDTGPGDLDPGWVEFFSDAGTSSPRPPAQPLRSAR